MINSWRSVSPSRLWREREREWESSTRDGHTNTCALMLWYRHVAMDTQYFWLLTPRFSPLATRGNTPQHPFQTSGVFTRIPVAVASSTGTNFYDRLIDIRVLNTAMYLWHCHAVKNYQQTCCSTVRTNMTWKENGRNGSSLIVCTLDVLAGSVRFARLTAFPLKCYSSGSIDPWKSGIRTSGYALTREGLRTREDWYLP